MADALKWAINNPEDIHYSVCHGEDALQISPNLICFQSVIHTIARRLERSRTGATKIIVDRQSQFNVAQQWLAGFYRKGRGEVFPGGIGVPELDLRHIPDIPITPTAGTNSVGLELVDMYLWTFKRFLDGKIISYELNKLLVGQAARGTTNEISIAGLEKRWVPYFEQLPDPTPEQLEKARKIIDIQEMRRAPHVIR